MSIYFVPNTSEEQYQLILDLLESVFTSEHEKTLLEQAGLSWSVILKGGIQLMLYLNQNQRHGMIMHLQKT